MLFVTYQPTITRDYAQPAQVLTQVMSATHS